MFQRFTDGARRVVEKAQEEAMALRHGHVGTEHLLLGLLRGGDGLAVAVLGAAGLSIEYVRTDIEVIVGGGPCPEDAAALRAIGIDLDAVWASIEESFGPGALERARRSRRWCRRPVPTVAGNVPFSPRTKRVLEQSLREALRLRQSYIGPEHLLLALAAEAEGVGAMVLVRRGIDLDQLRREVVVALGRVA